MFGSDFSVQIGFVLSSTPPEAELFFLRIPLSIHSGSTQKIYKI